MRTRALVIVAATLALAAASPAMAALQVTRDSAGRPITFDVQAGGADVAGYTAILDGLLHGAEISDVTITIVPRSSISATCGSGAAACYRWSSRGDAVMFVPDLAPVQVGASLAHEYGHHVDATRPHLVGARGLDGTAGWWRTRGMAALLAEGRVAWDYSLGWDRSIAEVFAEDYKLTNLPGEASKIAWLGAPPPAVSDAIRADLAGATVPPAPPPTATLPPPPTAAPTATAPRARPVKRASGGLRRGARARIRFVVAARGRVAVTVSGVTAGRLRAVLGCNGRALTGAAARPGAPVVLRTRRPVLGACRVTLGAVGAATRYRVRAVAIPVG